ncbi:MAG: hypothetical protein JW864_01485 [Spirochaetes bacterium]|nr:hypothetical protein [Spirochaetota bacterium]
MKIKLLAVLFSIFTIACSSYAIEEENITEKIPKWKNISGQWEIFKNKGSSSLYEKKCKYRKWNYNELINFNSIATLNPINAYDKYTFSFQVQYPRKPAAELMFLFAMKHYRIFYAFKYIIEEDKTELQFISSKITDPTLKASVKNNFFISVLNSKKIKFEFNKLYNVEIKINENKAELYIDGKKTMEAKSPENLNSGRIGFSSRNCQPIIDDVKIYDKGNIVFEDDFSLDLIQRWKVDAKRVD